MRAVRAGTNRMIDADATPEDDTAEEPPHEADGRQGYEDRGVRHPGGR